MKIQFWGAAREVTGSKHLLKVNGKQILLDCGLFQGHRKEADEKNRHRVLTLPNWMQLSFRTRTLTTAATCLTW